MNRIITYNLSDNFIQRLADFIEESFIKKGRDITKLAIVFGGRRPALFLKKELSRRIKKGYLSPVFFSIDEFIEYTLNKKAPFSKIQDLEASYLIYNLTKKISPDILKSRQSFSQFLPWAREILSFIEQLDLEAIENVSLKDVELKASIGYDVPENINSLLKDIIAIRQRYHEYLKKRNIYSRGLIYSSAAKVIPEVNFGEFEEIIFANFFYLHKTESVILNSLYQKDKAVLVFQGSSKDWTVLESLAKQLAIKIEPEKEDSPEFKLKVYAGFDQHSQVGLVREIVKEIKNTDKALIVLPAPESVIPLLSEISSCVKDFNVSMGYPLKRSSLHTVFTAIFKSQETKREDSYYAKDYLKVLAHPLIKNIRIVNNDPAITRVLVHKLEEVLTGIEKTDLGGSLFVRLSDLESCKDLFDLTLMTTKNLDIEVSRDQIKEVLRELHRLLFFNWGKLTNLSDFAESLGEFLDTLVNKSFLSNYPFNLKMAEKVFLIKDELQNASFNQEKFLLEDIFKIFENKLESEMIAFSGSPLKGLQILGFLETRSLNFENVIIMDCNESVLPKLKIYEPLIPREIMISLGLNRLEKEEEIQRYLFKRLIASAKYVHLIFAQNDKFEKSRFIEEIIWEKQKVEKKLEVIPILKANFKVKVLPKRIEIEKDSRIIRYLKQMRYSASSLDTYLNCPLGFYYKYILGLEEKEDLLQEPEARDIGNFIHKLLEESYAKFIGRKPCFTDKFKEDFFVLFEEKFASDFQRKMKSDSFLIKEILDFRLKRFLENEQKRQVKKVLSLERELDEKIELLDKPFKFKARIDRIDQLVDDTIMIIDYKTGSSNILPDEAEKIERAGFSRPALQDRLKSFQLPLYLFLIEKFYPGQRVNACLYNVRDFKDNLGLNALFKKEEQFKNKELIMSVYKKAMESLLTDIFNPEIPFQADDSDPRHCDYCPFFSLCR